MIKCQNANMILRSLEPAGAIQGADPDSAQSTSPVRPDTAPLLAQHGYHREQHANQAVKHND